MKNEKRCPRCERVLPRDEFYRSQAAKDGCTSYCRVCCKVYHYPEHARRRCKSYRRRYPERGKATSVLNRAVERGELPPPRSRMCAGCGRPAFDYHHHLGYEPEHCLDVQPLCRHCHIKVHDVSREGKGVSVG